MQPEQIKQILQTALTVDELQVKGEDSHFEVFAVGEIFDGLSRVKKQQVIYAPLAEYIADNTIHALTIKAYTPAEWEKAKKFGQPI
ncbi:BolA family protein [Celerinatantimonas sp. MCCC 1A17872]|uniref:BolA family protein n=1 Tax=Celerinatantimonas sp. MCCC 1A17872 TaxID=3177514 RepID=UPI0038C5D27B